MIVRTATAVITLAVLSVTVGACVPASTGKTDCYTAVSKIWPAKTQSWAKKIVWRESRNTPTAKNKRSTASGCFQMLVVHAPRFKKLGYSWSNDRFDAYANTKVALNLFLEQGSRPWQI